MNCIFDNASSNMFTTNTTSGMSSFNTTLAYPQWKATSIIEPKTIIPKDFYKRLILETEEWLKDVFVY